MWTIDSQIRKVYAGYDIKLTYNRDTILFSKKRAGSQGVP